MELHDLRARWQQAAASDPTPDLQKAAFDELLARRSQSPVAKMRRNARLELGAMAVCLLISGLGLYYAWDTYNRTLFIWLIIICLLCGLYYRRKLAVLSALSETSGTLRENIALQLTSLRALTRLYYAGTMWSLPITLPLALYFTQSDIFQRLAAAQKWNSLAIIVLLNLLVALMIFFLTRNTTRWYLQKLYGQHLDRLESSLRELDEPPLERSQLIS